MEPKMIKHAILYPLISYIMRGFVVFNLILGAGLFSNVARTREFFIINEVFTYQFWGVLFFLSGLLQLYTLIKHNNRLIRISLMVGVILQTFWMIALVVRQIESFDSNLFLLIFFGIILYIKFGVYLYLPKRADD